MTEGEKSIEQAVREVLNGYLAVYAGLGVVIGGLIVFIYISTTNSMSKVIEQNQANVNQLNTRMVGVEKDVKFLFDKVYYKDK